MKRSEETATAIARFARSDASKEIRAHSVLRLKIMDKNSRRLTGDALLIENGKRIMMEEMIQTFDDAESILKRLEKPKVNRSLAT